MNQSARETIIEWSSGHIRARAIHTAATLCIADLIAEGISSAQELAEKLSVHPEALTRLMRLLASYGIFKEEKSGHFALTDLAQPLLSNDPASLRAWLAYHDGDSYRWNAYGAMASSIKTGKPAFDELYGASYFDFIHQEPLMAKQFDEGMKNLSLEEEALIARSYDFSRYKSILDIGGGLGGQLYEILLINEKLQATLYELPNVIDLAQNTVPKNISQERVSFIKGSFFEAVPSGAELYLLKRVLHDWDDDAAVTILKQCAQAMAPESRLLIIEAIVKDKNERDFVKDIDVAMLVLFGGKERTAEEWSCLLNKAGLSICATIATKSMLSLLEVKRLA